MGEEEQSIKHIHIHICVYVFPLFFFFFFFFGPTQSGRQVSSHHEYPHDIVAIMEWNSLLSTQLVLTPPKRPNHDSANTAIPIRSTRTRLVLYRYTGASIESLDKMVLTSGMDRPC